MQSSVEKETWTEADLISLPDVGGKYEVVEGELLVTPAGYQHEFIIMRLGGELDRFTRNRRLGRVGGSNLGYWMKNGNLRCPDISFVEKARLKDMIRGSEGFLHGAPDLSVEILSPSDTIESMKEKAVEFFESGCRLVWIVTLEDETIFVLRPDGSETVLTIADRLDGEDVIPEFSLAAGELFEELE